jgi:uncharacterized membrane protein
MNVHHLLRKPEETHLVDEAAATTARVIDRVLGNGVIGRLLRGSWLGHPTHPLLVTVPIGAWISSAVLDWGFGDRDAARRLVAIGLAAASPTMLAGLAEYPTLDPRQRRVGLFHAIVNTAAAALFSASYVNARRRNDTAARCLTVLGLGSVGLGGALGGHLSYAQGAGVYRWQSPAQVDVASAVM